MILCRVDTYFPEKKKRSKKEGPENFSSLFIFLHQLPTSVCELSFIQATIRLEDNKWNQTSTAQSQTKTNSTNKY